MTESDFPDKLGSRTGFISSIDREEAFFDDLIPLQGYLNLDYLINDIATVRVRGGASYWVTNKDINLDNQLYLVQNMQINFATKEIGGSIGGSGRYHVFPKDDVF